MRASLGSGGLIQFGPGCVLWLDDRGGGRVRGALGAPMNIAREELVSVQL